MEEGRASRSAAWVTTCRALAGVLPPGEAICDDPDAQRLASGLPALVSPLFRARPDLAWAVLRRIPPIALSLYWIQMRTRQLDDTLRAFAGRAGDQVVLLGAGYDSRASRLRTSLPGVRFFEVDHGATQAAKRRRLRETGVDAGAASYVAFDLEREEPAALPERLAAAGLDRSRPTLTIWEGVTMYLSEGAASRTVLAVRDCGGEGSRLAFDYYRRQSLGERSPIERALATVTIERHEPFRFGFDPAALPGWLRERGFALAADLTEEAVADRLLDPARRREFLRLRGAWRLHVAEAVRDYPDPGRQS